MDARGLFFLFLLLFEHAGRGTGPWRRPRGEAVAGGRTTLQPRVLPLWRKDRGGQDR